MLLMEGIDVSMAFSMTLFESRLEMFLVEVVKIGLEIGHEFGGEMKSWRSRSRPTRELTVMFRA